MADWQVADLGSGTYLFRWARGFYASVFCLDADGVVAVDPIDPTAAAAYRDAVASVTAAPVTRILYSHDHLDHARGAAVLAPNAQVWASPRCARRIAARGGADPRPPTHLAGDGQRLGRIEVRDHGPSHSAGLLSLYLPTDAGRLLVAVDLVEPGVAPYRELPDTDVAGMQSALDAMAGEVARGEVDAVLGGHCGPDDADWVTGYRDYFRALDDAVRSEWDAAGGQVPLPGEDGVAMTERVRAQVCRRAAQRLRPSYGGWRGFDAWGPRTADRFVSYLITGN